MFYKTFYFYEADPLSFLLHLVSLAEEIWWNARIENARYENYRARAIGIFSNKLVEFFYFLFHDSSGVGLIKERKLTELNTAMQRRVGSELSF